MESPLEPFESRMDHCLRQLPTERSDEALEERDEVEWNSSGGNMPHRQWWGFRGRSLSLNLSQRSLESNSDSSSSLSPLTDSNNHHATPIVASSSPMKSLKRVLQSVIPYNGDAEDPSATNNIKHTPTTTMVSSYHDSDNDGASHCSKRRRLWF